MLDRYVGLPYKKKGRDRNGIDCYGLVRLVLWDLLGQNWPSYLEEDPDGSTIVKLASALEKVEEPRRFDIAIIMIAKREGGKYVFRPTHMGIFCNAFQVLHIEDGSFSRVQPAKELKINSILRVT